nr:hypothetical protein [uncultured Schaedlerella sp.]
MNRNKKGAMPEITREVYKNVKKFDRQQFTGFCTDICTSTDMRTAGRAFRE